MNRIVWVLALLMLALVTGCGGDKTPAPASHLSEAQRDTVLSRSDIPGARAVGQAFGAAEQAVGHRVELDSLPH